MVERTQSVFRRLLPVLVGLGLGLLIAFAWMGRPGPVPHVIQYRDEVLFRQALPEHGPRAEVPVMPEAPAMPEPPQIGFAPAIPPLPAVPPLPPSHGGLGGLIGWLLGSPLQWLGIAALVLGLMLLGRRTAPKESSEDVRV